MTLNIRAIPLFDSTGHLEKLELHLNNKESVESFERLLNKVLNTWEHAEPEWKELSDRITHGKILQDYYKNNRV